MVATCDDRELEETINSTLNQAQLEDAEALKVRVVEGIAYIDGEVSSYRAKKLITRLIVSAAGLPKVVNRSRVVPAALVNDKAVAERVRRAIQSHPLLASGPISLRCREGVVQLSGTVDRASVRLEAEDVAWSVRGVRLVVNKVRVSYERRLKEREVGHQLEQHLQDCLGLAPWQISVEVERGVAHLRGRVCSRPLCHLAEDLVRWHPDICDVVNLLIAEETSSSDRHVTAP
jgi:osmotically-inducible protein OsmY